MRALTVPEREDFLAQPHIGVLSVPSDDGRPPLTVPVWYGYEPGGNLTFFTGTGGRRARKTRLLERAGKLSFCVQDPRPPYRYVTVECTLVGTDREPPVADVAAIAGRYLPEPDANAFAKAEAGRPSGTFVLFTARPDRWLSLDSG
ncbi:pyridoxamine 5'-phosphate oxidase family protein [Actinophytocola gossypii]|uniref:Pyridoxamine 5'-phosphate oxidase family protein n=1 Tax=Actinophytocola gossypii TaxID=2812003 RepID=A0ABT2JJH6_9PSEU|nr:pyridoxamine 5'-phosphate oxidase family protein [Actinophytocola gossypii]MCT2588036.1 pyridoxamine 5'-phosphate oxidase family protein [Actinophytocola gossypii]